MGVSFPEIPDFQEVRDSRAHNLTEISVILDFLPFFWDCARLITKSTYKIIFRKSQKKLDTHVGVRHCIWQGGNYFFFCGTQLQKFKIFCSLIKFATKCVNFLPNLSTQTFFWDLWKFLKMLINFDLSELKSSIWNLYYGTIPFIQKFDFISLSIDNRYQPIKFNMILIMSRKRISLSCQTIKTPDIMNTNFINNYYL